MGKPMGKPMEIPVDFPLNTIRWLEKETLLKGRIHGRISLETASGINWRYLEFLFFFKRHVENAHETPWNFTGHELGNFKGRPPWQMLHDPMIFLPMGLSLKIGATPIAAWFIMEHASNMDDDWRYPYFRKPPDFPYQFFWLQGSTRCPLQYQSLLWHLSELLGLQYSHAPKGSARTKDPDSIFGTRMPLCDLDAGQTVSFF